MNATITAVAILTAFSAAADTRFHVQLAGGSALGKEQCDIRLQVDNEVDVTVRRDSVSVHTLAGQDARNDGSTCTSPLPDREPVDFKFQAVDGRGEVRLIEPPSRRNNYSAIVHIRDSADGRSRYLFRLTWTNAESEETRAPAGFSRNNVTQYTGRGKGESRLNQTVQSLTDATVDIDLSGKVVVSFGRPRDGGKGKPEPVVFTGVVLEQSEDRLKADMVDASHKLHGTMTIQVSRENVNTISMDATDGRDRLHLTWDRR